MPRRMTPAGLIAVLATSLIGFTLSSTPATPEEPSSEIKSRGVQQLQHPLQPAMPMPPSRVVQPPTVKPMQEPAWPQQFDVRGPETDG